MEVIECVGRSTNVRKFPPGHEGEVCDFFVLVYVQLAREATQNIYGVDVIECVIFFLNVRYFAIEPNSVKDWSCVM
jgi:hypothetical protein